VKEELTKVVNLLSKQELKVRLPKLIKVFCLMMSIKPRPVSVSPKRRRVPIKIVYPDAAEPKPTVEPHDPALENDTLKPISSRSLKPSPASTVPSPPTPTPVVSSTSKAEQTFKDAKNARDSTRPSRVGGGIFLASGDSKIFPTRGGSAAVAESKSMPRSDDGSSGSTSAPSFLSKADRPLTSWYDFSRAWGTLLTTEERWSLFSVCSVLMNFLANSQVLCR
jgi:hypothetical protein